MLKGVPSILSPELLKILMEMGHGDVLCIGDGNFPAAAYAKRLVRLDGHGVTEILGAILRLYPLDTYVEAPVGLMEVVPGSGDAEPPIWKDYVEVIGKHQKDVKIRNIERFQFYEEAKKAYCIVATGETALYANILLQKGVVVE
ncbi:MAG: RbsD/FucU family protein [Christensenellales bacterium]|jgi:L-fucose mutarotase